MDRSGFLRSHSIVDTFKARDMRFETGVKMMALVSVAFFLFGFFLFRNGRNNHSSRGTGDDEVLKELVDDVNAYVKYLSETHPYDPRIKRLQRTIKDTRFKALDSEDEDVGYSIDKGKVIAVCTEDGPTNEAIFVMLHELAHIATPEWGHTETFWSNFEFLIEAAENLGWYKPIDYRKTPGSICGTKIKSAP